MVAKGPRSIPLKLLIHRMPSTGKHLMYSTAILSGRHVTHRGCFGSFYICFWRRQWQPTPVLLPGKSHGCGQRSLVDYSPWGHEESDTTERLHFHFSLSCIGEGNGNPLQYSGLENPRDRRAWLPSMELHRIGLTWISSSSRSVFSCHDCGALQALVGRDPRWYSMCRTAKHSKGLFYILHTFQIFYWLLT